MLRMLNVSPRVHHTLKVDTDDLGDDQSVKRDIIGETFSLFFNTFETSMSGSECSVAYKHGHQQLQFPAITFTSTFTFTWLRMAHTCPQSPAHSYKPLQYTFSTLSLCEHWVFIPVHTKTVFIDCIFGFFYLVSGFLDLLSSMLVGDLLTLTCALTLILYLPILTYQIYYYYFKF